MIKLINILSEWKITSRNKYIDWLYDEEINEYYPVINKQRIKDYLESIIDPTMINSVDQWVNDTNSTDGLLETEIDFFGNRDVATKEEAFSIPESEIEEMAVQAMGNWLTAGYSSFLTWPDEGGFFPFKEDEMNEWKISVPQYKPSDDDIMLVADHFNVEDETAAEMLQANLNDFYGWIPDDYIEVDMEELRNIGEKGYWTYTTSGRNQYLTFSDRRGALELSYDIAGNFTGARAI